MSRLEQLIAELCPNGVEYEKFENVCKYIRGVTYKKTQEVNSEASNARKVLRANNITLSTNELNFDDVKLISRKVKVREDQILRKEDILICAGSGSKEHIGKTAYISEDMDYTFGGFMAVIRCCNELNSRFFFHILTSELFSKHLRNTLNSSTINNLNAEIMNNFRFPLPPLPVQQEIVRILDNFTELTAELTARRKQYEYYRDLLLTFGEDSGVKWMKIGEFAECYAGATPQTRKKEYWDNGSIPWMSSGEVNLGQVYDTEKKITQLGYDSCSTKMVPANTVVVALAGQGKTRGMVAITRISLCTNQSLCSIVPNGQVKSDFLYYYLKTQYQNLRLISSGDGTRGGLNLKMIRNYLIPVPPIEEQERIVAILDRFDALCNDLTSGLPAEIEARQKQYEYYRDKLLSFKEVKA